MFPIKFVDKGNKYIFMRYSHEEFRYRLWDLMNKKIVKSRNIVLFENQFVRGDDKVEKTSFPHNILVRLDIFIPLPIVLADH